MAANVKWPRSPNMRLGRRASATPAELLKPALVRRGSWSPNFRLTRRSSDSSAIINDKVSKVFLDWKRVHNNSAILSLLFWWISISCAVLCDCFPPRKAPPTRASLFRLVRRKGMSQLFVDINVFLNNLKKTWTDFFFNQTGGKQKEADFLQVTTEQSCLTACLLLQILELKKGLWFVQTNTEHCFSLSYLHKKACFVFWLDRRGSKLWAYFSGNPMELSIKATAFLWACNTR